MTPTPCPTIELETGDPPTQRGQTLFFVPSPSPSGPQRRAHLLIERGTDQIGVLVGVCGHRMLCAALAGTPIPLPQCHNPLTPAGRWLSNSPGRSPLPAADRTPTTPENS
jgi:hypothetical protein